ncbi:MAG: dTDP-4-dehydrorhamnose 3,5-epimerase [Alphaproteobacteria bacterium]|nr:dTDP-4-dehydrorhamnose 3,5-epimerase [Alphaproteobacteria bacterium]
MPVEVRELEIAEVKVLNPKKFGDHRGFFSEVYSRKALADVGIDVELVQDNHSLSSKRGTVRGLHFQIPPLAQAKLVRVVRGAILDVAVDLRRNSASFGKHVCAVISEDDWNQIFVPVGFAHGFITITDETEVLYKVSNIYSPEHERGILWNDPKLGIDWLQRGASEISARDLAWPALGDVAEHYF